LKKEAKNFCSASRGGEKADGQKPIKFFCFFLFTKRSSFFPFASLRQHDGRGC
jgi:hypothetical protein